MNKITFIALIALTLLGVALTDSCAILTTEKLEDCIAKKPTKGSGKYCCFSEVMEKASCSIGAAGTSGCTDGTKTRDCVLTDDNCVNTLTTSKWCCTTTGSDSKTCKAEDSDLTATDIECEKGTAVDTCTLKSDSTGCDSDLGTTQSCCFSAAQKVPTCTESTTKTDDVCGEMADENSSNYLASVFLLALVLLF